MRPQISWTSTINGGICREICIISRHANVHNSPYLCVAIGWAGDLHLIIVRRDAVSHLLWSTRVRITSGIQDFGVKIQEIDQGFVIFQGLKGQQIIISYLAASYNAPLKIMICTILNGTGPVAFDIKGHLMTFKCNSHLIPKGNTVRSYEIEYLKSYNPSNDLCQRPLPSMTRLRMFELATGPSAPASALPAGGEYIHLRS